MDFYLSHMYLHIYVCNRLDWNSNSGLRFFIQSHYSLDRSFVHNYKDVLKDVIVYNMKESMKENNMLLAYNRLGGRIETVSGSDSDSLNTVLIFIFLICV